MDVVTSHSRGQKQFQPPSYFDFGFLVPRRSLLDTRLGLVKLEVFELPTVVFLLPPLARDEPLLGPAEATAAWSVGASGLGVRRRMLLRGDAESGPRAVSPAAGRSRPFRCCDGALSARRGLCSVAMWSSGLLSVELDGEFGVGEM